MRARSSERCRRRAAADRERGFTVVELVAVLVLLGLLAAVALPRLGAGFAARDESARDTLLATLRHAQAVATSHRRLVCATVAGGSATLAIATANPAAACTAAIAAPGASGTVAGTPPATSVAPPGPLYFQPDGRVTTDGAGLVATDRTIAVGGADAILVTAETGLVR